MRNSSKSNASGTSREVFVEVHSGVDWYGFVSMNFAKFNKTFFV